MLRMLLLFCMYGTWEVFVLGLTLNVAAFSLCITLWNERHADPMDNVTVHLVTIKCLGIVVLRLATHTEP